MTSLWPVVWLAVFAVDASLAGRGRSHQVGGRGRGRLVAVRVVSEALAARRHPYHE
jgi:hypothetical protein